MTHDQIVYALNTLYPTAAWQLNGDNYENLIWLDQVISKPSKAQIQAEIATPTARPELTVAEKLATVGLSIDDLKAALA